MKKSNLTESNFETSHVTKTLVDNGYFERLPDDYNKESMKTNTKSNLKLLFKTLFDKTMADMYESDLSFYKKIEENSSVKEMIKDNLFEDVFRRGKEINQ